MRVVLEILGINKMANDKSGNILLTTNTQVCNAIQGAYYKWAIQKAFDATVSELHSVEIEASRKWDSVES